MGWLKTFLVNTVFPWRRRIRSPFYLDWLSGARTLRYAHFINGKQYHQMYVLADGIYRNELLLCPALGATDDPTRRVFKKHQEAVRKDVERAFGVLQQRFPVVGMPSSWQTHEDVVLTAKACVILHNMIIRMRKEGCDVFDDVVDARVDDAAERAAVHDRYAAPMFMEPADLTSAFRARQADLLAHVVKFDRSGGAANRRN